MKRALTVIALVIAAAPLVFGQAPAGKPNEVEQTLIKMEHDLTAALLKRNIAAMAPMLGDDLAVTTPDGNVMTRTQFLADVKSGDLTLESSQISDMKVRVLGDAAVVTYSTTDKGKYKGQDIGGRYRWTDVFALRGGKWLLVAGHGTAIAPPPK